MTLPPLGLDIAKLKFNARLVRAGGELRHKVFNNNPDDFARLSDWLREQGVRQVHACLEATGTYGGSLAAYLYGQEHIVSVVNPAAIKAYAQSHLSRTKTDRVDAALIAGFRGERRPPAWHPPAREVRELQALVRRLEALVGMRTAEENRLSSGIGAEAVRVSVEELIAHLSEQIKRTEALIRGHIDNHPGLKRQSEMLDSIPGVGATTAAASDGFADVLRMKATLFAVGCMPLLCLAPRTSTPLVDRPAVLTILSQSPDHLVAARPIGPRHRDNHITETLPEL